MTSIAHPSSTPRWLPKTEADLQAAIDGGILEENHYLDLKEASGSTKGANRELARDLASFAIDGGTLVIGVREDKESRTFELAPQPLHGLPEKVEQVARTIPDPPLNVTTEVIETASGAGYLIIHVPASPAAPHMVDGRYLGRGDKTKITLTDPQVLELHARRNAAEADVLGLLQQEMDDDPLLDSGDQSHLFLVAQPSAGRRDLLLSLIEPPDWSARLARLIRRAEASAELAMALRGVGITPDLGLAYRGQRRAGGIACCSDSLGDGRLYMPSTRHSTQDVIELQMFEDGGLRIYQSRFSDSIGSPPEQMLLPAAAVVLTRQLLEVVRLVSDDVGYFGNWSFAVGASRLRGRASHLGLRAWVCVESTPRYTKDTYQEATGATRAELTNAAGAVTRRLLGPLLRSLNVQRLYEAPLTGPV
ncbi:helix-turn-helix domain-containing protein [Streptomyces sp. NPDC102473]|uniref:AlbA family DNA-binding domain-containing protein n=1 Tax=Streptomyces sp. NPDC102473 TaxID=3366180 RepID=UPI0038131C9F